MRPASVPEPDARTSTLVREREIVLHGHRVRYLEAGASSHPRPVLLLVHGITSRADGWEPVMQDPGRATTT